MSKVTHLTLDESGGLARRRIHLREISGDADSPLGTVGQDLRAARLRRGDDLATVSKALKIRKDHLEAIEEDRLDALPGRTYAIGFVRSYSEYLGLDPVLCVERFKAEIAGRDDAPAKPAIAEEPDESRLPHGWVVIAAVVLLLLAYGAYHLAISADSILKQPVEAVPARMAPKVAAVKHTVSPPIVAAPATTSNNTQSADDSAQASNDDAGNESAANEKPPIPLTSNNSTELESGAQQSVNTAATQDAAVPKGFVYGQQNADARVVLRVLQPTRVVVQGADGTLFINRVLKPGDSYQVPNRTGLVLSTPNGSAVEIVLDGQAMGRSSAKAQVVEGASLDPQAIVDRFSHGTPG